MNRLAMVLILEQPLLFGLGLIRIEFSPLPSPLFDVRITRVALHFEPWPDPNV